MSYYKIVDGKKMDGYLLNIARRAVEALGDGRISKEEGQMFKACQKPLTYTNIEKEIREYIRTKLNWTEGADDWIRTQI